MVELGIFAIALPAAILCALLVPPVRAFALSRGIVDKPDPRKMHPHPVPRLGGIAIFSTCAIILGVAWLLGDRWSDTFAVNPRGIVGFALGACVVFATGVYDDLYGIRARTKLAMELLAAVLVTALGGCQVTSLSFPGGTVALGALAVPLTIVWIVVVTNAVNLIDGLDGLAAGVSFIALGSIATIAIQGHHSVSIVIAILMGACVGFLFHNFHPATIFMGDSGSLFLGYALAVLSTYASAKSRTGAITLATMLVVALPLADTFWAMARRYLRGLVPTNARSHMAGFARMFVPDRKHIHHRLVGAGLHDREALYVLYAMQLAACAVAIYVAAIWAVR